MVSGRRPSRDTIVQATRNRADGIVEQLTLRALRTLIRRRHQNLERREQRHDRPGENVAGDARANHASELRARRPDVARRELLQECHHLAFRTR